jgi:hypothetical protein
MYCKLSHVLSYARFNLSVLRVLNIKIAVVMGSNATLVKNTSGLGSG